MNQQVNPTYVRFRESHHAIARMFAAGWTISKVAHETGFTRRRLHILLGDPLFQELVVEKSKTLEERIDEGMDHFYEIHYGNTMMAARRLNERLAELEEQNEHLSVRDYLAIVKDGADRFGYGVKSTRININADFAASLDRAIERADKVKVIEAQPVVNVHPNLPRAPTLVEPRRIEKQVVADPGIASVRPAAPARAQRPVPSFAGLLRRGL